MPGEKREGTDRDNRAKTKPELLQALLDLGVPYAKVQALRQKSRWAILFMVQQAERENREILHSGSAARTEAQFASLVTKATLRSRGMSKADQAREIQRRQQAALASTATPDLGADVGDDEDVRGTRAH